MAVDLVMSLSIELDQVMIPISLEQVMTLERDELRIVDGRWAVLAIHLVKDPEFT